MTTYQVKLPPRVRPNPYWITWGRYVDYVWNAYEKGVLRRALDPTVPMASVYLAVTDVAAQTAFGPLSYPNHFLAPLTVERRLHWQY